MYFTRFEPTPEYFRGLLDAPVPCSAAPGTIGTTAVLRREIRLCFARIKSAFEMNNIQRGDVTL
jgi:hypothetical protein